MSKTLDQEDPLIQSEPSPNWKLALSVRAARKTRLAVGNPMNSMDDSGGGDGGGGDGGDGGGGGGDDS